MSEKVSKLAASTLLCSGITGKLLKTVCDQKCCLSQLWLPKTSASGLLLWGCLLPRFQCLVHSRSPSVVFPASCSLLWFSGKGLLCLFVSLKGLLFKREKTLHKVIACLKMRCLYYCIIGVWVCVCVAPYCFPFFGHTNQYVYVLSYIGTCIQTHLNILINIYI